MAFQFYSGQILKRLIQTNTPLKKTILFSALQLTFSTSSAFAALGFPDCPAAHCSGNNADINAACVAAGLAGKPFPLMSADGSVCTCACSCITADTGILLDNQTTVRIDSLERLTTAFTPHTDAGLSPVEHLLMSSVENTGIHRITFEGGRQLLASPNHTLVKENGFIDSIENIKEGTGILTGSNSIAKIIRNKIVKNFSGRLWNLVVRPEAQRASDHVIVTNDIQSGDFLLQSSRDRIRQEISLRLGLVEPLKVNKGH